jgi:hypothetical protein
MNVSKGLVCSLLQSYSITLKTAAGASNLILCVGTPPDDATVDTITAAAAVVTGNSTCTYNTTGIQFALNSASEFPPRYVLTSFPTTNTVNATKAGTISWGLLTGSWGVSVVDVGLPNSGSLIEVNTTNVSVGTPVTITNWSFKLGR